MFLKRPFYYTKSNILTAQTSAERSGAHTPTPMQIYNRSARTDDTQAQPQCLTMDWTQLNSRLDSQLSWLCSFIYSCKHALRHRNGYVYTRTAAVKVAGLKDPREIRRKWGATRRYQSKKVQKKLKKLKIWISLKMSSRKWTNIHPGN